MIRLPIFRGLILTKGGREACVSSINKISTLAFPLQFRVTPAVCAMPLKKKKKVDPAVIRAKNERKKKRIEKEIRKLSKNVRPLKPVADFEIPDCLNEELERRTRSITLTDEVTEERIILLKEWSKSKFYQARDDKRELKRIMEAQEKALSELRLESEKLYQAAVEIDQNLIPFKFRGPAETPPKEDYFIPDGVYKDVSKQWK